MEDNTTSKTNIQKKGFPALSQWFIKLTSPPKTQYEDFFENARFNLSWSIMSMFTVSLVVLACTFLFVRQDLFLSTVLALFIIIFLQVHLYQTRTYRVTAFGFSYIGSFLCIFSLFFFKNEIHYNDALWSLVIILFAFFTLPFLHAITIFTAQVIAYVFFISVYFRENIITLHDLDQATVYSIATNFAIATFMIGYIINQYIRIFRKAQKRSAASTEKLSHQNAIIKAQNEEKTVMLQEIHHRIKNNLQVITSLLRLQSKEVEDIKSKESFLDSVNRVMAISSIHEKMYQNNSVNNLNLEAYIKELTQELITTFGIHQPIEFEVTSEVSALNQDKLVPFALIINELVTNSIKHGFTSLRSGRVKIYIQKFDQAFGLIYSDNGTWKSPQDDNSFGLEMIDILTDQLEGQKELSISDQTTYTFKFPMK